MKSEKEKTAEEIKAFIRKGMKVVKTEIDGTSSQIITTKIPTESARPFKNFFKTIASSCTETRQSVNKYNNSIRWCIQYLVELMNPDFVKNDSIRIRSTQSSHYLIR